MPMAFEGHRARGPYRFQSPINKGPAIHTWMTTTLFRSGTILIFGALLCLVVASTNAARAAETRKSVLLIYEARSDMLANVVVDRAIRKALTEKFEVNPDIYSEYFESSPSPRAFPLLLSLLRHRYSGKVFDVVVPVGTTSLELVREYGEELFPGAEVVYLGRKMGLDGWPSEQPIAGLVPPKMEDQVRGTVEFIRTLQPGVEQLFIVTGNSSTDKDWEKAAQRELTASEGQISAKYLSGLSLEDLQSRIVRLPQNAAVLFLSMGEDGAGKRLLRTQVLGQIVQAATAPVYLVSALDLDTGTVGGALIDQEAMATEVAQIVGRLLDGADIRTQPVHQTALVPTVNWQAMNKWGLDESRLPLGTLIKFRDPSVWDTYGWHILGILSLCLIEGGLIVALLAHRRNRRRAEIALLASRRLLQSTIDALNARVALLDHRGTIIALNRSWKTFAEANCAEGSVKDIGFNYLDASAEESQGHEAQLVSRGIQQLMSGELDEFRCVYPSAQMDRTFWFQVRISRFELYGAGRMVVVYEDVTEIKEAHDAQQKLTGLLMNAQDAERRRIARELHDSTVQDMVAIKAGLACLGKGAKYLDTNLAETWHESVSLCNQVIKELRTLSYVLHPPLLDEAGLVPALTWFVRGFIQRSGIPVELMVVDNIGRLPLDVETALFRVVQESLTNIHRHSGGGKAVIEVTRQENTVGLRIMDDGHGFSLPATEDALDGGLSPGVGIAGMRQRLNQLGGQLDIESGPQGTTVNATVCLSEDRDHAYLAR